MSWTSERARGRGASPVGTKVTALKPSSEAGRNLAALRLEEHVLKVLATAPRPSDEQLQRIAAILLSGGAS